MEAALSVMGTYSLLVAGILSFVFIILYTPVQNKGPEGWHLWRLSLVISIITGLALIRSVIPDEQPIDHLLLNVNRFNYLFLACETGYRIYLLVRNQRDRGREYERIRQDRNARDAVAGESVTEVEARRE